MSEGAFHPRHHHALMEVWRNDLARLLQFYEGRRSRTDAFFPKLFLFFFVLNATCYCWAMATAFPGRAFGFDDSLQWMRDFLLLFPVGFLGAVFDSLSFFITVVIVKRALSALSTLGYLSHLSIDLLIAVCATCWVVFVFWASGLLLDVFIPSATTAASGDILALQNQQYQEILVLAVLDPTDAESIRNIYFGAIMGVSAMLPTFAHVLLCLKSATTVCNQRLALGNGVSQR